MQYNDTIDPRTRQLVTPCRVVTTAGDVRNADALTLVRPAQVSLRESGPLCVLTNPAEGEHASVLLDFGRELHGLVSLSVYARSGVKYPEVRVRLGESVGEALTPLGERGTTNDHANRDTVITVAPYSDNQTNESGFRFACIELLTPSASVTLRAVQATYIFRDLPYIGSFECSDPKLNEIWKTAAYTVHLNMQRYLWDGIKRDRLVWAGDMNTEIQTVLAVFGNSCDVVQKSLDFNRDCTPAGDAMNGISAYSLWWLVSHFDWYMGTGDLAYLTEQKDYMEKLLDRFLTYIDENGAETMPAGRFFDWPNRACDETTHAGLQGFFRYVLVRAVPMMNVLGNRELAARCAEKAKLLATHIPDPQGRKQPAAMLALGGIGEPREWVEKVILPNGAADLSTFLGYFTLVACARYGHTAEGVQIIRDYWGRMLDMGATTFWEDFNIDWAKNATRIDELPQAGKDDIHGDFGAFCYLNFRHSLCHGWASGPAPFLTKYVLGVRPFKAGFDTAIVCPNPVGLQWVKGTVPTPHGTITVEYEDGMTRVDAPKEIKIIEKPKVY